MLLGTQKMDSRVKPEAILLMRYLITSNKETAYKNGLEQHQTSLGDRLALTASLGCRTHMDMLPYPHILATGSLLINYEVIELDLHSLYEHFRDLDHCQSLTPAVLRSRASRGLKMNATKCTHLLVTLTNSPSPLPGWLLLGCLAAELAVFEP